jgi:hypothetical protein
MKHTLVLITMLAGSVLAGGCSNNSSSHRQTKKPAPQTQGDQTDQATQSQTDQNSKNQNQAEQSNFPTQKKEIAQAPLSAPTVQESDRSRSTDSTSTKRDLNQKTASEKSGINGFFTEARNYVGVKAAALGEALHTTEDTQARRDALNETRNETKDAREQDLASLKEQVLKTSQEDPVEVSLAIKPLDETTTLLAALIFERDPAQIEPLTYKLIDEIFNEPEMARAKIMEVQLGIRHLAKNKLYSPDAAKRVAFLQANLDRRIKTDQNSEVLRDGLLIAGTSIAIGTVAGFHGFDKLRDAVHEYPRAGTMAKTGVSRIRNAMERAGQDIRSIYTRAAGELQSLKKGLPSEQVAARNLKALGLNEDTIQNLDLIPVSKYDVHFQVFEPTNLSGFRYAVTDMMDATRLDTERVIVFTFPKTAGIISKPPVVTRRLSMEEAERIKESIRYRSPEEGGKQFATIVDTETGATVPTRIPSSEIEQEFDSQLAQNAVHISPTRAEVEKFSPTSESEVVQPREDEAASPHGIGQTLSKAKDTISDVAHSVAENTKSATHEVAQSSRRVYDDSVAPALRRFDTSWALAAGVGSALPLYGLYYSAYDKGHDQGQDYETVYLESLVPAERLNQITLVYDQQGQRD